nr:disulfide bond formation protein DsbB [uncultured Haemophilus sp.]
MLTYFKELSLNRAAWLFLALMAFLLESTGLFFQYGMGLQPCVMCVYERLAILGLFIAGILGALAPRIKAIRYLAIVLWGYSAIKGLLVAIRHTDYQLNPSPWNQCEFKPDFPQTLPLDQWFPQVFAPGPVNCSESQWEMFGWGMPQWLIVAFGLFSLFFVLVLISQFKKSKQQYRSVFR